MRGEANGKGVAIQAAWTRVNELLETGRVTREELEVRMSATALELLDQKILPSLWYPIDAGAELSQLVVDVDGRGQLNHMAKLGAETAQQLLKGGTFKTFVEGARQNKKSLGNSLVRLAELMVDFGDWSFEGRDLFDFEVVVTGAEPLPETTRFSVQGFIGALTSEVSGRQVTCQSERPSPDTVVFRGRLAQ